MTKSEIPKVWKKEIEKAFPSPDPKKFTNHSNYIYALSDSIKKRQGAEWAIRQFSLTEGKEKVWNDACDATIYSISSRLISESCGIDDPFKAGIFKIMGEGIKKWPSPDCPNELKSDESPTPVSGEEKVYDISDVFLNYRNDQNFFNHSFAEYLIRTDYKLIKTQSNQSE